MCAVDDAEPWQFFSAEERRARKPHRCEECGREIAAGEQYRYARGLVEGHFEHWASCLQCEAARSFLVAECGGSVVGYVRGELEQHWGYGSEYRSIWLARAIVGIRRAWRTRSGALQLPLAPYRRRAPAQAA